MNDDMMLRSPQEEEVFRRVWQRVMGGREDQTSPIEVSPPTMQPMNQPMNQTMDQTGNRSMTQPMDQTMEQSRRWVDGDMSCDYLSILAKAIPNRTLDREQPVSDLPAVGMDAAPRSESTARLRQQTLEALEAWQFYRHLARRTRGNAARTLTNLAADQHQLARKLAAAYFLHSGVRYWPSEQLPTPAIPSFWGALRQRHQWERQAEMSYRMSADEADDATLTELYEGLMESCRGHCRQLRMLLEQSCP